ncbi:hypothetical protein [Klebsiella pneumoniae]
MHLFTLREEFLWLNIGRCGESGVRLVVPSSLHKKYPEAVS